LTAPERLPEPPAEPLLVDRLFRSEAGRLVAALTRRLGSARLALAEDAVQDALVAALQQWPFTGLPADPSAWLWRVALNRAIDHLRRRVRLDARASALAARLEADLRQRHVGAPQASALTDDELRMVLLCCHPSLPEGGRVALSLKLVSGFSVREIARALLSDERAIAQRLVRAKRCLRSRRASLNLPLGRALGERVDSALAVIYLLFNEGYGAHAGENLVRFDLCAEALRLGRLLARGRETATPKAHALLALMALHAARLPARVTADGDLVRLDDQDRRLWDPHLVREGFEHLRASSTGAVESSYHLQAAIAAAHAAAPDARATDWESILSLYDRLLEVDPSPIVRLNRAVAVARVRGPQAGLEALVRLERHPALRDYGPLRAVLADLLSESGDVAGAVIAYGEALDLPCTAPERRFLWGRIEALRGGAS